MPITCALHKQNLPCIMCSLFSFFASLIFGYHLKAMQVRC